MSNSSLRGFLNILVLKTLVKGPKSGYALMRFVHEKIGIKPSPGSMYPLLENLSQKGLLKSSKKGKTNTYALTQKGKTYIASIEEKRGECLCRITEAFRMLSTITGEDMQFPIAVVQSLQKGVLPFKEINPEWNSLREELFTRMQQNALQKNAKRIRAILGAAKREIHSL